MSPDTFLVIGLGLGVLSIAALLTAWADGRLPKVSVAVLLAGLASAWHGHTQQPGGYTLQEVPMAVYRVIAQVLN